MIWVSGTWFQEEDETENESKTKSRNRLGNGSIPSPSPVALSKNWTLVTFLQSLSSVTFTLKLKQPGCFLFFSSFSCMRCQGVARYFKGMGEGRDS